MRLIVLILTVSSLAATACAASSASAPREPAAPPSSSDASGTATPAASPSHVDVTPTISVPTVTLTETETPIATPTLFSEVLATQEAPPTLPPPVTQEPLPESMPGGSALSLPANTSVVWGGCASDGQCNWFNFYWAPTREVVMQYGERQIKVQHELCHAHQHWSINGGEPLEPSDYDLESWYQTDEGRSFTTAVQGLSWVWSHSAVNGLEDFAWTCAYWHLQPAELQAISPERYAWAIDHLP